MSQLSPKHKATNKRSEQQVLQHNSYYVIVNYIKLDVCCVPECWGRAEDSKEVGKVNIIP